MLYVCAHLHQFPVSEAHWFALGILSSAYHSNVALKPFAMQTSQHNRCKASVLRTALLVFSSRPSWNFPPNLSHPLLARIKSIGWGTRKCRNCWVVCLPRSPQKSLGLVGLDWRCWESSIGEPWSHLAVRWHRQECWKKMALLVLVAYSGGGEGGEVEKHVNRKKRKKNNFPFCASCWHISDRKWENQFRK